MSTYLDSQMALVRKLKDVVDQWATVPTHELILRIIDATGEDHREVLQEADYKIKKNLWPPMES